MSKPSDLLNAILGRSCARWKPVRILEVLRKSSKNSTTNNLTKTQLLHRLHQLGKTLTGIDRQAIHSAVQLDDAIPDSALPGPLYGVQSITYGLSGIKVAPGPTGSHSQANMPTNLQPYQKCDVCLETLRGNFFPQRRIRNSGTGGCDAITCGKCGHEFCFSCYIPYEAIRLDRNRHARDCTYHPNNVRVGSAISDYYPVSK
jgi:hypothetical protein